MTVWVAIFEGIDEHELIGVFETKELAEIACDTSCDGFLRDYFKVHPFRLNKIKEDSQCRNY